MFSLFRDMTRGAVLAVFGLVLLIGVLLVGTFGFGWFRSSTADYRGSVAQTERVFADPDFRIASYEMFFNLCGAVKTQESAIKAQTKELTGPPAPSAARADQLRENLAALETNRASLINQYNAKAAQTDTRGHFLSSHLPYSLNESSETTTCAV